MDFGRYNVQVNKPTKVYYLAINNGLKEFWICVLFIMSFQFSSAQNLIPDSSFESNKFIPLDFSAINASYSWSKPSRGTGDLFCKCGKKQRKYSLVNVPQNPMGNQHPHSGFCYAGLFAFSHGSYREYLQTSLKVPLEKNKTYKFKMHISLADYSRAAIDQLGICFLINEANYKSTNVITCLNPVYLKIENEARNDTINWHCLTAIYRSNGEESYLVIGSFKINEIQKTKVKAPKEVRSRINQISERDAYYFIDDVSLIEIVDSSANSKIDSAVNVETKIAVSLSSDTSLILMNILFKTDEAILLSLSFSELDKVVEYLKNDQEVCLEITGHTDNIGIESHNQTLSSNRAKAVSDYIISKGIDRKRIAYTGSGSLKPIAKNDTKEGRRQNRRVEFIIKTK